MADAVPLAGFFDAAWADHAAQPGGVADRLAAVRAVLSADDVAAWVQLVVHVHGEHLGRWNEGIVLLERLGDDLPAIVASAQTEDPAMAQVLPAIIMRARVSLQLAAGQESAADALPLDDRVSALAVAAAACAGQGRAEAALALFDRALALAGAGQPVGSAAIRALAVGGNNLAATLEERPHRRPEENDGMVRAARTALLFWRQCGGWLEHERAEYRLASSLLRAGAPVLAAEAARRCLAVCVANHAPPFERFFGHVMLAVASKALGDGETFKLAREAALACHAQLDDDERTSSAADRALLETEPGRRQGDSAA